MVFAPLFNFQQLIYQNFADIGRMLLDTDDKSLESPPCKKTKLSDTRIVAVLSEETVAPVPLLNVLTANVKNKKHTSLLGLLI